MSREAKIVNAVLDFLPPEERVLALACNVIQHNPEAVSAVLSLSALLTVMAGYLDKEKRIMVAEVVRDSADAIERRPQQPACVENFGIPSRQSDRPR